MKKLLWIVPIVLLIACARAADIKFAWDYITPMPSGFEMRIMDMTGTVIKTLDCGAAINKECTVTAITPGARQAQCFAYNVGIPSSIPLEYSDGSNIVQFTVPIKSAVPSGTKVAPNQVAGESFGIAVDDNMVVHLSFNKETP